MTVTHTLAGRRARRHAERIAAEFDGTPVLEVTNSPMWGAGKVAYATTLPDGTRLEVSWSKTLPFGPWITLGIVLPPGFDPDDEDSFRSFYPHHDDGLLGLRHAYHKATGSDLPRRDR